MKKNTDFITSDSYLQKLDSFFLSVGEVDRYKQFAIRTLEELKKLISYDQAVGLFVNATGKVEDYYLVGVSENWGYAYREYYARMQAQFPLGMQKDRMKKKILVPIEPIIWSKLPGNEFIADCIGPRGVQHSLDFSLYDNRGRIRLILALDRTRSEPYSEKDVELINRIFPHLDNMHRKFFLSSDPDIKIIRRKDALLEIGTLTSREKEVVSCLCEGISPADISATMDISQATVYKHIANIYKKINVNNLQELLVYFLNEYKDF